ncbi:iron ABC transporter permease [Stomatohabitans albus]|uniref:FecCD family ABC transporter permease n=1 Tax=Stomatohabitans albus TaxID=3110766 RepID=UPI00300C1082
MGLRFGVLGCVWLIVIVMGITIGSVTVSLSDAYKVISGETVDAVVYTIVHDIRIPRTITAVVVGAAIGVSGLIMQTLFRNPLADPYVLGISSGGSLGVALVIMGSGALSTAYGAEFTSSLGLSGQFAIVIASAIGSGVVMALVLGIGHIIRSSAVLLLLGVMIGYFVSAFISVLIAYAEPALVAQFTRWGFGSYTGVTWDRIGILVGIILVGLAIAFSLAKPLNALLLGERYAQTMGIEMRTMRWALIAITSILAGVSNAFCGPIAFIGIAVPHVTRGVMGSSDHRVLIPGCILGGGAMALLADVIAQQPGTGVLPINAVNAAFGAPIVIVILLRWYRGMEDR